MSGLQTGPAVATDDHPQPLVAAEYLALAEVLAAATAADWATASLGSVPRAV